MEVTMTAQQIMSTSVLSLREDSSLREAWDLFREHKISGAPVVDCSGELVGVVSQHDLARRALSQSDELFGKPSFYYMLPTLSEDLVPAEESKHHLLETPIEEIMNPYVVTVSPGDSLSEVAATMRSHHVHRVIVAEDKKILGIISTFDLLAFV